MKKIIFLLFVPFLFNFCTKEVELYSDDSDVLVLNSLIVPDSMMKINLGVLSSFENYTMPIPEGVEVECYRNDTLMRVVSPDSLGWCRHYYFPEVGNEYSYKISYRDQQIFAKSIMPHPSQIIDAYYSMVDFSNNIGEHMKVPETTIKFYDDPHQKNYYEIVFMYGATFQIQPYFNDLAYGPLIKDPILINEGDMDLRPTTYFFSDEMFEGDTCELVLPKGGRGFYDDYTGEYECDNGNYIVLRTVSEEYYLYRKFWTRHLYNQQNSWDIQDPIAMLFQGQPVPMYTNVEQGLGVFAAYSQHKKYLKYKP